MSDISAHFEQQRNDTNSRWFVQKLLGVSQMLTIADGGGGGVQEPLILADVICEQPLSDKP